jgi:hypothetical protein
VMDVGRGWNGRREVDDLGKTYSHILEIVVSQEEVVSSVGFYALK